MTVEPNPKRALKLYQLLTEFFWLLDDGDRRALAPFDLSIPQYNALRHLSQDAGLSINQLSDHLLCDKSNATRLVERMKNEGLVDRQRSKDDRRFVEVSLTEAGAELRHEAVSAHEDSIYRRLGCLNPEEQDMLLTQLTKLRDHLRHMLNGASGT